ncbi:hypothetical protein GCM10027346_27970 [Hymenobacter seoulensis]
MEQAGLQKVMDQLPQGVRDFLPNSWEQINKWSTTQKVAGAVALAGIGYLALRSGKSSKSDKYSDRYAGGSGTPRGSSSDYGHSEQKYSAGNKPYGSYNSQSDSSRRSDMGSGSSSTSGFDRENQSRAGGSYQSGNSGKSSGTSSSSGYGSGSGSTNQSSMANRSTGYRGSSSSDGGRSYDNDFGSEV